MVKQDETMWHNWWSTGNIDFHQDSINQDLKNFVSTHKASLGKHVLVPLCGKSLDMLWLMQQGFKVTGVEISEQAIQAFFDENKLSYKRLDIDQGVVYESGSVCLIQKSFFEVSEQDLNHPIDWIYDRAALIALNQNLREHYAKHLNKITCKAQHALCISMERSDSDGPPFSVKEDEVYQLYQGIWNTIKVKRVQKNERLTKTVFEFFKV